MKARRPSPWNHLLALLFDDAEQVLPREPEPARCAADALYYLPRSTRGANPRRSACLLQSKMHAVPHAIKLHGIGCTASRHNSSQQLHWLPHAQAR